MGASLRIAFLALLDAERRVADERRALGAALRRERDRLGVGLRDLARRARVDAANLSKVERGRCWSEPMVRAAMRALGQIAREAERRP